MQRVFSFLDYGPNGFATGFVVGNGLVMTAYHAVSGNLTISKKFNWDLRQEMSWQSRSRSTGATPK